MSTRNTEQLRTRTDENGKKKTEHLGSYAVMLTRIGEPDVIAWRVDGCRNKQEAIEKLARAIPNPEGYNVKNAVKLYNIDFENDSENFNSNLKNHLPEIRNAYLQDLKGRLS